MRAVISKWGNSPALRLPRGVMDSASLVLNQQVEISVKAGRIEITPVEANTDLDSLLDQITPNNLHTETNFGAPVGKELF